MFITIINIYMHNHELFNILNSLHINLNIIATFFYIITFCSLINQIKDKKNIMIILIFTIFSLVLLKISNDLIFFTISLITYIIVTLIKLQSLQIKRYNKIAIASITLLLLFTIMKITIIQPHLLERINNFDQEISFIHERLNNSKIIGNANISQNENAQYYYMNFSNYSFIYLIEQYGKLFGIFILTLLSLLAIKIIINYRTIKDNFGKLLVIGIGTMIFTQSIISLLTILRIVNIEVINMPFITHDNASIIFYMMGVSLIISIYSRKNLIIK